MPAYVQGSPSGVMAGDQVSVVVSGDALVAGYKSRAVVIGTVAGQRAGTLRVQVDFGADPGTFEVDLQESDTDVDADYQTVANVAANSGAPQFSCYIQYVNPTARFYRLYLKTLTNAISKGNGTLSI